MANSSVVYPKVLSSNLGVDKIFSDSICIKLTVLIDKDRHTAKSINFKKLC
jgi:hypothetical protein